MEESDKVKIMQSLKHLYNVSPHGLFQTSLKIRQFGEIPSCDVFILSHNTIYLLGTASLEHVEILPDNTTTIEQYSMSKRSKEKEAKWQNV